MLLRIAIIITVYQRYFHLICGPLFSIMAVMVAGFRPYKKTLPNVTDSVLWLVGSTGVFWHNYLKTYEIPKPTFIYIFFSFPFLCILFCISGKIFIFLFTKCQAHCIRRRVQTRKNTTNYIISCVLPCLNSSPDAVSLTFCIQKDKNLSRNT